MQEAMFNELYTFCTDVIYNVRQGIALHSSSRSYLNRAGFDPGSSLNILTNSPENVQRTGNFFEVSNPSHISTLLSIGETRISLKYSVFGHEIHIPPYFGYF